MMFSPVMLLDQVAGDLPDAAELAVAVGVLLAGLDDRRRRVSVAPSEMVMIA